MKYLRCDWNHNSDQMPVTIYAEYTEDGWQTRKVEVFRNGSTHYADEGVATGDTGLSDQKTDFASVLKGSVSLSPAYITEADFAEQWSRATQ